MLHEGMPPESRDMAGWRNTYNSTVMQSRIRQPAPAASGQAHRSRPDRAQHPALPNVTACIPAAMAASTLAWRMPTGYENGGQQAAVE